MATQFDRASHKTEGKDMRHRLFDSAVLAAVAIGALLAGGISAFAAVTTNQTIAVAGTNLDPCSGQVWAFSGFANIRTSMTTDSSGGMHLDFWDNVFQIKLTNTVTGAQGVGTETDHATINLPAGANEFTVTSQFTSISAGPTDNFIVLMVVHTTINADGTTTSNVNNVTATCVG
jgi:hypothetical protein